MNKRYRGVVLAVAILVYIYFKFIYLHPGEASVSEKKYETEVASTVTKECVETCLEWREEGRDLSNGPCLSNELEKDWVCDVAHVPRRDVDRNPENQCSNFRERKAHHFVELDENCNFLKKY